MPFSLDKKFALPYNLGRIIQQKGSPSMKYYLGIDLGGTNIAVGLCDESLNILEKGSVPTLAQREGELIIRDMAALCQKLLDKHGIPLSDVACVGIATPGSANNETGVVEYANNLNFVNFPIAQILHKYLPANNIQIANDANAAALGEAIRGCGCGAKSLVMITLGTGVGGGVIIDGKILVGGVNVCGAELGHTVLTVGGRQCSCGRRGCWEAYSSATALTAMTKEKMTELSLKEIPSALFDQEKKEGRVSARTAFEAMRAGDEYGKAIVDNYIEYLAAGVCNMINIFQPEVLCIGGGICNEKDYLLKPLLKIVDKEQYTRNQAHKTKVCIAALGNDAGIIGAAALGK